LNKIILSIIEIKCNMKKSNIENLLDELALKLASNFITISFEESKREKAFNHTINKSKLTEHELDNVPIYSKLSY